MLILAMQTYGERGETSLPCACFHMVNEGQGQLFRDHVLSSLMPLSGQLHCAAQM